MQPNVWIQVGCRHLQWWWKVITTLVDGVVHETSKKELSGYKRLKRVADTC